jgi:hypothetical protein
MLLVLLIHITILPEKCCIPRSRTVPRYFKRVSCSSAWTNILRTDVDRSWLRGFDTGDPILNS